MAGPNVPCDSLRYGCLWISLIRDEKAGQRFCPDLRFLGQVDWIRTSDPLTPSQVRYQTAPPPVCFCSVSLTALGNSNTLGMSGSTENAKTFTTCGRGVQRSGRKAGGVASGRVASWRGVGQNKPHGRDGRWGLREGKAATLSPTPPRSGQTCAHPRGSRRTAAAWGCRRKTPAARARGCRSHRWRATREVPPRH